jgi:hypothetical protein
VVNLILTDMVNTRKQVHKGKDKNLEAEWVLMVEIFNTLKMKVMTIQIRFNNLTKVTLMRIITITFSKMVLMNQTTITLTIIIFSNLFHSHLMMKINRINMNKQADSISVMNKIMKSPSMSELNKSV